MPARSGDKKADEQMEQDEVEKKSVKSATVEVISV